MVEGRPRFLNLEELTDVDAISVTANWNGFTILRGYASSPEWRDVLTEELVQSCNLSNKVVALDGPEMMLFLVPRTKGHGTTLKLITDLFVAIERHKIKTLDFTHYACLRGNLPEGEILEILNFLFNPKLTTCLETLIWKVDARMEDEMRDLFFRSSRV